MYDIHLLFPTPILVSKYNTNIQQFIQYAYQVKEQHQSTQLSNRKGYQSPLLDIALTSPLRDRVDSILKEITSKKLEHHQQWININQTGAYNTTHTHPQSDYSVVYYLQNDNTAICFNHPDMHSAYNTIAFLHDNVGDQLRLSPQFRTVPRAGDLYIFPAHVPHSVDENTSTKDRISIAWNVSLHT